MDQGSKMLYSQEFWRRIETIVSFTKFAHNPNLSSLAMHLSRNDHKI
ncbi:hypothetical protein ACFDR9_002819 [Janthinobacterium sp. CG_23.3]